MIFKLHLPGSTHDSFLMGTMHVQDERAFAFADHAVKCMEMCDSYAGETDLGKIEVHKLKAAFTLDPDKHLDAMLTPKKLMKYRKILLKCFDIDLFHHLDTSPMYIQSIMMANSIGKDRKESLDHFLYRKASEMQMELWGLESADEQYEIAKKLSPVTQLYQLKEVAKKPEKYRKMANKLCDLYAAGKLDELYRLSKKGLGEFRKVLLYDRNVLMAERIFQNLGEKPGFFSAGAGHLPGNKGILALLKRMGVEVSPHAIQP
ncbi:MAG: TraB/GumN family protein [Saprospiraceae bacterium]|nr:TraB/GumN family protein [Saprospiraceae bacterium]